MTTEELMAIEARANVATAGPWFSWYEGSSDWAIETTESERRIATCYRRHAAECPDAPFIAHARTDVPALVAEVRRLRGLVEAAFTEGQESSRTDRDDMAWGWPESDACKALEGE